MKYLRFKIFSFLALALIFVACNKDAVVEKVVPRVITLQAETAQKLSTQIRQEVAVELADDLELTLWAADTLVTDPVGISIDPQGRIFYCSAKRLEHSEFDIRSHRNWMTASISFQSVEDRRAFIRKTFAEENEEGRKFLKDLNEDGVLDWRDLTVEKEEFWFVEDADKDGVADRAQLYLEDFNEEITDLANGVEMFNGELYIAVGPDLWRTKDIDNDGICDETTSISHGFAVHIGFGAHGMSGVTVGPDGRIWWGIGDIGMNVTDQEGKNWKYPNRGVIARSEPDGSNFEVFAHGVRNTHEFAFDQYGNLITEDNDGDHQGERERLVYLINGSDTGWRINWQFGKYTDPDNNSYKVWMDEKMGVPRWEGQAAYILPPIANYVNGPTGFVYNPGTALGERWYNHFFVAEFRGTPSASPIHAFSLKPKGATFELEETVEVAKGLLPTGLDFGPDGALYFGDWINGWGVKKEGRIWKLDVPGGAATAIRQETKKLIEADFSKSTADELAALLKHQDMRVRSKSQFELVNRGEAGGRILLTAVQQTEHQLARIHGLWGIGQLARKDLKYADFFPEYLNDNDPEICAQAAKLIGDVRYDKAGQLLIPMLQHESLRVRFFACEALGRTKNENAIPGILQMLAENDDEDSWLRMGGMIALGRIGKAAPLLALQNQEDFSLRIAAVVALRRMNHPDVAKFLEDKNELVVTEAARAINDDFSIEEALPALADILNKTPFQNEALIRRSINANLRVGNPENITQLAQFIQQKKASEALRAEAIAALSTWAKPSLHDRVDGRYRGEISRDGAAAKAALGPLFVGLLNENKTKIQMACAKAAVRLEDTSIAPNLLGIIKNKGASEAVQVVVLEALQQLGTNEIEEALSIALAREKSINLRAKAVELIPKSNLPEPKAVTLFKTILEEGALKEQQAVFAGLGGYTGDAAVSLLVASLNKMATGNMPPEIHLDIIDAIEMQKTPELLQKLEEFQASKSKSDDLALYRETLFGGEADKGRSIFYDNEAAQCVRCHAIFEFGGNAGPNLTGASSRMTDEQLLRAVVLPSTEFAAGYEMLMLNMKDGETIAGILIEETTDSLKLKIGKSEFANIDKTQIDKRENMASSMPDASEVLTKKELRDLLAFLKTLELDS